MSGKIKCIIVITASLPLCLCALLDDGVALHNAEIRMRNNPYVASVKRAAEYMYEGINDDDEMRSSKSGDDNIDQVIIPEAIKNIMKREAYESTALSIQEEALEILNSTNNSLIALCCNMSMTVADDETPEVNTTVQMANERLLASGSRFSNEGGPSREKIGALVIGLSVAILVVLFAIIIINCFTLKIYLSERRERKIAQSLTSQSTESDSSPRAGGGHSPEFKNYCNQTASKETTTLQASCQESPSKFEGLPFEISIHPQSYLFHSCHSQAKSGITASGRSVERIASNDDFNEIDVDSVETFR